MKEVRALLAKINITGTPFAGEYAGGFPALDHCGR